MILYFSGTGNSRYAAQLLGQVLGDEVHSLGEELREGKPGSFRSDKPYVIVFPVYCWGMPRVVQKLLEQSVFSGNQKVYYVATCGHWSGNTAKAMKALSKRKGLDFQGLATIKMPANYVAVYAPPQPDQCAQIVADAHGPLLRAADRIGMEEPLPAEQHTVKERLFTRPANALFYALAMKDKGFHTTENCTHCGACEKVCPLANISLAEGSPAWNGNCTHCMACICHCPNEAIEYKDRTSGRRRYRLAPWPDAGKL